MLLHAAELHQESHRAMKFTSPIKVYSQRKTLPVSDVENMVMGKNIYYKQNYLQKFQEKERSLDICLLYSVTLI